VHRSITLVDFQLVAQNFYLFTYNTFIKILHVFLASPCSSLGGLRRNCIYAASGIVTLCRWLSRAPVVICAPDDEWSWNFFTIAEGRRDDLTSARCCNYSYMCSWLWVELPPETCRAVYRNIINCIKSVTGGKDQISGECSLGQTIPI
jgi:hypothetical protein